MTKNQKIALGCGGAGCLGIIVLIVLGLVLSTAGYLSMPGKTNDNYNINIENSNRNSNSNSNVNSNFNRSTNSNTNSFSSSSSTMSTDDKHRLYQAAGMTKDSVLMLRVFNKIGLGDGTGSDHQAFIKQHFSWAMNNLDFIQSVNTPETARAYVEEHIDD